MLDREPRLPTPEGRGRHAAGQALREVFALELQYVEAAKVRRK
jgi:hypothetical protein